MSSFTSLRYCLNTVVKAEERVPFYLSAPHLCQVRFWNEADYTLSMNRVRVSGYSPSNASTKCLRIRRSSSPKPSL